MTENCLEISYSKTFHLRRVPYNLRIWMTYLQVIRQRSLFNDYKWLMHTCMFFWLKKSKKSLIIFQTGTGSKRRYTRMDHVNHLRFLYQTEMYLYINFYFIPYLRQLFSRGQNLFVWVRIIFFFFHVLVILVVSHNSIRRCIHQSVGPSAGLSIGPFITFSLFY